MMTSIGRPLRLFIVVCGVSFGPGLAGLAENPPAEVQNAANAAPITVTDAEKNEAKAIFAGQCGWCHGSYGMTADKGPRLAGTEMTDQEVRNRIHNGKPGYMPSFSKFLNDQQIALMAKYIKSLKPEN
jgi:mono/diheme cytochrome c family protein